MGSVECIGRLETPDGLRKVFYLRKPHALQARLVAPQRPGRVLWQRVQRLPRTEGGVHRARLTVAGNRLVVRWQVRGREVVIAFPLPVAATVAPSAPPPPALLERVARNPILAPRPAHEWESLAVFNAAAIELGGQVHFVYRAVGHDGLSVFGHAASRDGMTIDERSEAPVFIDTGTPAAYADTPAAAQDYCSGPGRSGCEDPRLTRIGDTVFMTYTAFDGQHPPGVALTSIAVDDFAARRWDWKPPVLISPLHEAHKNWVVFPEPIAGRFAVLHGISPGIMIDYHEALDFDAGEHIASHYACSGRDDAWDNRLRGAGPPPIKTPAGWLLLYHAMDRRDPGRYKLGAMLLDLYDPCRILGRLSHPLLEPDERYENEGLKSGVIYACGAVVSGGLLHVYYGGADTVVCAGTVPLDSLLAELLPAARPAPSSRTWRLHDHPETLSGQPPALREPARVLGVHGRVQSQRRPARWHLPPRLSRAVGHR